MKNVNRLALWSALAGTLILAACSSTPLPPAETAAPVARANPQMMPAPAPQEATVATTPVAQKALPAYLDPSNPLSKNKSVFFDFDQFVVKADGQAVLEMHGKFLAANPAVKIKVEGNTDEQGGAEYNLALGQKRAEAVVKTLKVFGVKDAQLEAVSFGKEKPQDQGRGEAARAQNRRADLAYPSN
jgi:peptidoglycan-associated lipoprotein